MSGRLSGFLLTLLWLGAIAASAALLDEPAARWVKAHHPLLHHRAIVWALKAPGYFYFTLAVAAALAALHRRGLWAAAWLLSSGVVGGLLYVIIKWLVGRNRPSTEIRPWHLRPFAGGLRGLFVSPPHLSFPSGHATLAFATAAALGLLIPRWRWAFLAAATAVGAERVLENAHYISDVLAGAGVGVFAALLVFRLMAPARRGALGASAGEAPAGS